MMEKFSKLHENTWHIQVGIFMLKAINPPFAVPYHTIEHPSQLHVDIQLFPKTL